MDVLQAGSVILGLGAAGLALRLGARLVPVGLQARRDLRELGRNPEAAKQLYQPGDNYNPVDPPGRLRDSTIVGLFDNALRRRDGSYTAVYDVGLQNSFYGHGQTLEALMDDLGRMAAVQKPPGTLMQWRYAVQPDRGRTIAAHLRSRSYTSVYLPACRLHDLGVDFYRSLCEERAYRTEHASFNITVPIRLPNDATSSGLSQMIPTLARGVRAHGGRELLRAFTRARSETRDDGVVRRLVDDEEKARESAERIFRIVENHSPLPIMRLDRERLWEAVYQSHCLNAASRPRLSNKFGLDIRDMLCGESIESGGWYMLHGETPVAMVSMMRPGDALYADAMRAMTAHPGHTFRHTLVTELIYLDQRKAIKRLDRRIRQVRRTNTRMDGRKHETPEARAAIRDLEAVRDHVAGSPEALTLLRSYALVYGDRARTRSELKASLRALDDNCQQLITALQTIDGVEAAIEEPAALLSLYPQTMLGEAEGRENGREFMEVANSLICAVPVETAWRGPARPHTLFSTKTGRLTGLNLYDKHQIPSPVVIVLGRPGTGKSTILARAINDVLASVPAAAVKAVDIGGSLAPHALSVGARYFRFDINDPRTINVFDYPELKDGEVASDEHISLIVMDAALLASLKPSDDLAPDLLTKAVKEVLINFARRNGPGKPKIEPTLVHLHSMLESYDFGSQQLNDRAIALALTLEKYVGNRYLDAPTHPDFNQESPYDVFELDSLDAFPPDVRMTLANRAATRVIRSIGKLKPDGTRTPTLLVFDEVWKLKEFYPTIMRVIQKGARTGRRDNAVTMLATHTYEDFNDIHDITKTAGCKLIGKQQGDYSKLIAESQLSEYAVAAINAIKNVDGEYTQWLLVLGSGQDQIVETIQCDLAPAELWTFTTNAYERDARARVSYLKPEWTEAEVIAWLAGAYPRGLAAQGLIEIDETALLTTEEGEE